MILSAACVIFALPTAAITCSPCLPWCMPHPCLPTVSLAPAVLQSNINIARFFEAPDSAAKAEKVAPMEPAPPAAAPTADATTEEAVQQDSNLKENDGGDTAGPSCGNPPPRSPLAELPLPAAPDGRSPAALPAIKREPGLDEGPAQERQEQQKQGESNAEAEPMVIDLTDD